MIVCNTSLTANTIPKVMPKEQAAHFCKVLIYDGNSIAPLNYHAHRIITQENDSLTTEQLFSSFVLYQDNWLQMRLFPHSDGNGNVAWCAPGDEIPESIGTEHIKYMREVLPLLRRHIDKGDWNTVDEIIDKLIKYQCTFGNINQGKENHPPIHFTLFFACLAIISIIIITFAAKRTKQ